MERPVTDEDIVKFLRFNKAKYISQIELMQAAVQLLWPLGPPNDAGQRIAKLVMQELNSHARLAPPNRNRTTWNWTASPNQPTGLGTFPFMQ